MKKAVIYFFGIILLMISFSLLIYPTPYRYLEYDSKVPVKVNVITGKTKAFTPQYGWYDIENKE